MDDSRRAFSGQGLDPRGHRVRKSGSIRERKDEKKENLGKAVPITGGTADTSLLLIQSRSMNRVIFASLRPRVYVSLETDVHPSFVSAARWLRPSGGFWLLDEIHEFLSAEPVFPPPGRFLEQSCLERSHRRCASGDKSSSLATNFFIGGLLAPTIGWGSIRRSIRVVNLKCLGLHHFAEWRSQQPRLGVGFSAERLIRGSDDSCPHRSNDFVPTGTIRNPTCKAMSLILIRVWQKRAHGQGLIPAITDPSLSSFSPQPDLNLGRASIIIHTGPRLRGERKLRVDA